MTEAPLQSAKLHIDKHNQGSLHCNCFYLPKLRVYYSRVVIPR